jgi:hypothetical protein
LEQLEIKSKKKGIMPEHFFGSAMAHSMYSALCTAVFLSAASHVLSLHVAEENRCGWFSNPTPGNAWLEDRDGEWTVGIQGNHEAEGDWPSFKRSQRVVTNG